MGAGSAAPGRAGRARMPAAPAAAAVSTVASMACPVRTIEYESCPKLVGARSTLTCLPLSTSFFSREETHELRTDSVRVIAIEPPQAGRP